MNLKKLSMGALLAVTVASAYAAGYYHEIIYFADASRSTVVGVKITHCGGQGTETSGTVTPYYRTVQRYSCDGPIP